MNNETLEIVTHEEVEAFFRAATTIKLPYLGEDGESMSNYGHTISDGLEEKLKNNPNLVADYAAWNWHGDVWYMKGQFNCYVCRYHCFVGIVSAHSLKELMEKCCEEYGGD